MQGPGGRSKEGARRGGWRWLVAALVLTVALSPAAPAIAATPPVTNRADAARTGWYSDQSGLTPGLVGGGSFGQLFSTQLTGQVYAQPLVADNTLFVATEDDWIYGLDPVGGGIRWSRNVGTPFNSSDIGCSDLTPHIGVTGTPVIDPDTRTAYFFAKSYDSSNNAVYYAHAVSLDDGSERSGFPVQITGAADNDPSARFDARHEFQRPGLLLMDGVVYAAFGGHCDITPYRGWVVGVSTSGHITSRWSDTTGSAQGAGIWQSGGGLVSDADGEILLATGNGIGTGASPPTGPGSSSPGSYGESVVRLAVQSDGTLEPTDFFTPSDADQLDNWDADLGSGGPVALPPVFGAGTSHPNLLADVGKEGYVYLLDRSNLGGRGQGANAGDNVVARVGPNGGVWSSPAVWPGDNGWLYVPTASGSNRCGVLDFYQAAVTGTGDPTLSLAASTPSANASDLFCFGSSSPVVTSNGTTSGSALVWIIWDGTPSGQLRAYLPNPVSGATPTPVWTAPIGDPTKFTPPGVAGNRIYVGNADGQIMGFGAPVAIALSGPDVTFPATDVGSTSDATAAFTAQRDVTVDGLTVDSGPFGIDTGSLTVNGSPATLPVSLHTGDTLDVPATFTPSSATSYGAGLHAHTTAGSTFSLSLSGSGRDASPHLIASPPLVSFGGAAVGDQVTRSVTFTNDGGSPLTVNAVDAPGASGPFSIAGAPAVGSTIGAGDSATVNVTFAPTAEGDFNDSVGLESTGGSADVGLAGSARQPPRLELSPAGLDFGEVPLGGSADASFTLTNTGGSDLTITKSKPPDEADFQILAPVPEGTTIAAGQSITASVRFLPGDAAGAHHAVWTINANDDVGVREVSLDGNGSASAPAPAPAASAPSAGAVAAGALSKGAFLTPPQVMGLRVLPFHLGRQCPRGITRRGGVRFRLTAPALVRIRVSQRGRTIRKFTRWESAGTLVLRFGGCRTRWPLRPGPFRVTVVPLAALQKGKPAVRVAG